jgi:Peptidase family S41
MCRAPVSTVALAALLLFVLSACSTEQGGNTSRALAVEDIDFAMDALEDIHPNLYWRSSSDELARRRRELVEKLPANPSGLDLYLALRELTALTNDLHVSVGTVPPTLKGPNNQALGPYLGSGTFPALLDPDAVEPRVWQVHPGQQQLHPDDEIVSINGTLARDLLTRLQALEPGSTATKQYAARTEFGWMLALAGIRPPYKVTLVPTDGRGETEVTLQGLRPGAAIASAAPIPRAPIEYRLLEDHVGLISFYDMTEGVDRFKQRLVSIFNRVAADRPKGLIIDLRENAGGNSLLGDLLLGYITDKAYRTASERRWKVSRTCQKWFGEQADAGESYYEEYLAASVGQTLSTSGSPYAPLASKPAYRGPVAALIGPATFSSGSMLADAMSTYHLATLFGQPTNEPASMYGWVCEAKLPNSGIRVVAPSALFIRANGDVRDMQPVAPDVVVEPDSTGHHVDAALEAARRWIKSQSTGQ